MEKPDLKNHLHQANTKREDLTIIFNAENPYHQLPVSIINGKEKGKVFTLVAGIHGYEYPPIIALQELLKEINPENLKGTLIILPIANIGAFFERVPFLHPEDRKNLNYVFPGTKNGTISEQIADYISQNIIPVTDVFIDLHGGDSNEDLIPFSCYYENSHHPENTQIAQQLCEISGLPYMISFPYDISTNQPALYAFKQAIQSGKIGLSLEAGKLGNLQKDCVKMLKNALYNMLDWTKIYPHPQPIHIEKPQHFRHCYYIKSSEKGIFHSHHIAGNFIKKGELLGYITDIFGTKTSEIIAPNDGLILYKIGTPPINKNETIFCVSF